MASKSIPSFRRRLALQWFMATHAMPFSNAYLEQVYRIYLNHAKVVHWRDGYPVYSLSTPALFSKPAANFLARMVYRSIQNRNVPNIMSYAVNDECNARCTHCSFYEGVDDKTREALSLEQAQKVIREAQELGVSVFNFVGGEPLLRKDLPEIIRSVDKELATTVLFTNGAYLADQARVLRQAGLDSVYVSIDSADPEVHDRLRGTSGLYDQALAGIARAKAAGLSTGISCSMTPESFERGEMHHIVELGKRLGVHEVIVFDTMPTGRFKWRTDLYQKDGWTDAMIRSAEPFNRDPAYPGVLVWAYVTSHEAVGCSWGTNFFYVSPYGDVMSCDFNHTSYGNLLERPLYQIWDELSSMPDFAQSKWGGCKIKDPEYVARGVVSPGGTRPASPLAAAPNGRS
jgi:MoaA/NifB/PqqE/SkfB family radical SAM enzyme